MTRRGSKSAFAVGERIAVVDDEIGLEPGAHGARARFDAEHARSILRRGGDRLDRREPGELTQHRDLVRDPDAAGVVLVGIAAVRRSRDRDAEPMRLAHRRSQRPHHGLGAQLQRHVVGGIALRIAERAHDRERRHEKRAAPLHLGERLVVHPGAVLDAAHARADRIGSAFARVRMRRDEEALLRRLIDGGAHLVFRQLRPARIGIRRAPHARSRRP